MAVVGDVADVHVEGGHQPRANKLGLWLFIVSETFLFSAVISSKFVVTQTFKPEELNQPLALAITIVLLLSSISAYLAEASMAHDNRAAFNRYTLITIGLGVLFMVGVVLEWNEALRDFPPGTIYGSAFVALIGLHAFHVLTGLIALGIVLYLARRGRWGSRDYWPVEGAVKYWHFVDVAWVVIYPTLYLF